MRQQRTLKTPYEHDNQVVFLLASNVFAAHDAVPTKNNRSD
jgi:hypothetical protein